MIDIDSSALIKLLLRDPETAALRAWLNERYEVPSVSSELASVEVVGVMRRITRPQMGAARTLLAGLELVPLSGAYIERAAEVGDDTLRSLDALHLASALAIREESAFACYDRRLNAAAQTAGLELATLGH